MDARARHTLTCKALSAQVSALQHQWTILIYMSTSFNFTVLNSKSSIFGTHFELLTQALLNSTSIYSTTKLHLDTLGVFEEVKMDTTGFAREHYHLIRPFTMPGPSGGKSAIAVPASFELMIISAYTILVGSTFMAWWIIIAVTISMVAPKNFRECRAIKLVGACSMTEPFQAASLLAGLCCSMVITRCSKRKAVRTTRPYSEDLTTLSDAQYWRELFTGFAIMLLAFGIMVGGIIGGIYLPKKLIIGQVAPVNNTMVFTAPFNYYDRESNDPFRVFVVVTTKGIGRAVSTIDSSGSKLESELEKVVHFDKKPTKEGPNGEEGYNITYSFRVHSYDMGLQHLHGLSVSITGKCYFEYGWYKQLVPGNATFRPKDVYTGTGFEDKDTIVVDVQTDKVEPLTLQYGWRGKGNYSDGVPKLPFAIVPRTQGRSSMSASRDPWYLTTTYNHTSGEYNVLPGRPPLYCNEERAWSYRGSYLGPDLAVYRYLNISNSIRIDRSKRLARNMPDIPTGIWTLLSDIYPWGIVSSMFQLHHSGKLESSWRTNVLSDKSVIDGESSSAYSDVKRMAYAAYLKYRNVVRDAALSYVGVEQLGLSDYPNAMRDENQNPFPGTGDFVVPSDNVRTLRLQVVVAIPAVAAFSWVIVAVVTFQERRRAKERLVPTGIIHTELVPLHSPLLGHMEAVQSASRRNQDIRYSTRL
ncbi:hypothetical protein BDZ91DRAFT_785164 [Kalaharituber pfeilii]|nr:hypothetical protein BDZ91DRAFT_785164 [Kalaharituber pfeilii]